MENSWLTPIKSVPNIILGVYVLWLSHKLLQLNISLCFLILYLTIIFGFTF